MSTDHMWGWSILLGLLDLAVLGKVTASIRFSPYAILFW